MSEQEWPMTEGLKTKMLDRLEGVVSDPAASHRTIIMAGKLLAKLLDQQQARDRLAASKPPAGVPFADVIDVAKARYEARRREASGEQP